MKNTLRDLAGLVLYTLTVGVLGFVLGLLVHAGYVLGVGL